MPSAAEPQPSRNISRKDAKAAKVEEKWQKASKIIYLFLPNLAPWRESISASEFHGSPENCEHGICRVEN
jgi:hypothetical protein